MFKKHTGIILMLSTFTIAFCEGTVESWDPETGSGTLGPGGYVGCAYLESMNAALTANVYACEWPEEYPGSDEPGAAYKEGQAAAEDADCHEDQETD